MRRAQCTGDFLENAVLPSFEIYNTSVTIVFHADCLSVKLLLVHDIAGVHPGNEIIRCSGFSPQLSIGHPFSSLFLY